jgi:A/G-specific adenine glycosylase
LRYGVAFWLTRPDGAVLLRRRPEKGLLGGMIEVPSTPWRVEPWSIAEAVRIAPAAAKWSPLPGTVRHGFTHFHLELAILTGRGMTDGMWSRLDRLGEHALPTLMKKIARHAISALAAKPHAAKPHDGCAVSASGSSFLKSGSIDSPAMARRTGAKDRR